MREIAAGNIKTTQTHCFEDFFIHGSRADGGNNLSLSHIAVPFIYPGQGKF